MTLAELKSELRVLAVLFRRYYNTTDIHQMDSLYSEITTRFDDLNDKLQTLTTLKQQ